MLQTLTEPVPDSTGTGSHAGETATPAATEPPQSVTLIELLTHLAIHKRLIAKVTAITLATGALLSFLLPVRYTATTEILPPHQTQSTADLFLGQVANTSLGSLAGLAGGGLGLKSPDDLYIGLLGSRPVADGIIHQFDLQHVYRDRDMTAARQKLTDNTAIVSEKTGLISVSVTDGSRKRAADLANAYPEQLRLLMQTLAVTEASQRRLFYEEQLKRAKDDVVKAEAAFQQVQQRKGLVQPDAQAKALIANLASLRAQVAARRVEVQALRSYSTERNPDVQLAENQLAALQAQVSQLEQRNPTSGLSDGSIADVPAAGLEYVSAEHELLYRQTLFDLLVKQYDAARLDEAKEATIIQVVAPAIPPDRKSSPRRSLIIAFSMLAGFFAASCYVLAAMALRRARRTPATDLQFSALKTALRSPKSETLRPFSFMD